MLSDSPLLFISVLVSQHSSFSKILIFLLPGFRVFFNHLVVLYMHGIMQFCYFISPIIFLDVLTQGLWTIFSIRLNLFANTQNGLYCLCVDWLSKNNFT